MGIIGVSLGIELVDSVTRLCAMNLLLHGIGSEADGQTLESGLPVVTKDALAAKRGEHKIVLANPPLRQEEQLTIVNEAGETSKDWLGAEAPVNETGLTPARGFRGNRLSSTVTTFGRARATSSSTFSSTSSPSSSSTVVQRWWPDGRKSERKMMKEEVCWRLIRFDLGVPT